MTPKVSAYGLRRERIDVEVQFLALAVFWRVESREGEGTCVTLALPRPVTAEIV
jgi:hypothetical protein